MYLCRDLSGCVLAHSSAVPCYIYDSIRPLNGLEHLGNRLIGCEGCDQRDCELWSQSVPAHRSGNRNSVRQHKRLAVLLSDKFRELAIGDYCEIRLAHEPPRKPRD